MPTKAKTICTHPGCNKLAVKGSRCEEHSIVPARSRKESEEYHRMYNSKVWKIIRLRQLSSEPLCASCKAKGKITPATICDHIEPHKGDWELFIDPNNLQSLCKSCHDSKTAREDGGFGNRRKG